VTGFCTEDEATLLTDEGPETEGTEGTFYPRIKIRIYNALSTVTNTQLLLSNLATHLCKSDGVADFLKRPSHMPPGRMRSFKCCQHKYMKTPNIEERWNSAP